MTMQRQALNEAAQIDRHVKQTVKAFKALHKDMGALYDKSLREFPDQSNIVQRGNLYVKYMRDDARMVGFLDRYIGRLSVHQSAKSWRNRTMYAVRDVYLQKITLADAIRTVEGIAAKSYVAMEMHKAQKPVRKAIPDELMAFLPKNIVVEVDREGFIRKVTDRFENERLTLAVKIERQKQIVREYNEIVKRVRKDMKSRDEIIRLSALVTAIVMETGIRPGKYGNAAIKKVNGEKIKVETFGAITLTSDHVRFVRNEFVELEFVGKKGGVNLARISDKMILSALQDYVDRAMTKGSKFVFVTEEGTRFTYTDLQRYFRDRFSGIAPTDFRKLRATQTVLESLNEDQKDLYDRIRRLVDEETDHLKQKVVEEIVATVGAAYERARAALSHDSMTTTVQAYINPEVVLRFLSEGRTEMTMQSAILDGKPALSFNEQTFINRALGKSASGLSLRNVLQSLEKDLEEEGTRSKVARSVADIWLKSS